MACSDRIVFVINQDALVPAPTGDSGQINGLSAMRTPARYLYENNRLLEFADFKQANHAAQSRGFDHRHVDQVLIQVLTPTA